MFHPSHRTALLLNLPSGKVTNAAMLQNTSCVRPTFRYLPKSVEQLEGFTVGYRELHQSRSNLWVKEGSLLKPSTSGATAKALELNETSSLQTTPRLSIIEKLRAVQWSLMLRDCSQGLTVRDTVRTIRNLPSNMAAGYTMVKASREYELARNALIITWNLSVRVARVSYLWLGVFFESREYFYLRYYVLLTAEHTVRWLRHMLKLSFDTIRLWVGK